GHRRAVDYLELGEEVVEDGGRGAAIDAHQRDVDELSAAAAVDDRPDLGAFGNALRQRVEDHFFGSGRGDAYLDIAGGKKHEGAHASHRNACDTRGRRVETGSGRSNVDVDRANSRRGVEKAQAEVARPGIDCSIVEKYARRAGDRAEGNEGVVHG